LKHLDDREDQGSLGGRWRLATQPGPENQCAHLCRWHQRCPVDLLLLGILSDQPNLCRLGGQWDQESLLLLKRRGILADQRDLYVPKHLPGRVLLSAPQLAKPVQWRRELPLVQDDPHALRDLRGLAHPVCRGGRAVQQALFAQPCQQGHGLLWPLAGQGSLELHLRLLRQTVQRHRGDLWGRYDREDQCGLHILCRP